MVVSFLLPFESTLGCLKVACLFPQKGYHQKNDAPMSCEEPVEEAHQRGHGEMLDQQKPDGACHGGFRALRANHGNSTANRLQKLHPLICPLDGEKTSRDQKVPHIFPKQNLAPSKRKLKCWNLSDWISDFPIKKSGNYLAVSIGIATFWR